MGKFTHKISNNNKKGVYGFYNVCSRATAAAGGAVHRNRPENSRGQTDFQRFFFSKNEIKNKKSRLRKKLMFFDRN